MLGLVDQRTTVYDLNCKLSIPFYSLEHFFLLMNASCANSLIVYNMMDPNELTLLDFKAVLSTNLVGCCKSKGRGPSENKTRSKRKYWHQPAHPLSNLSMTTRM